MRVWRGSRPVLLLAALIATHGYAQAPVVSDIRSVAALPEPVTNNAVAAHSGKLFSLLGLTGEKTHEDIVRWQFQGGADSGPWMRSVDIPGQQGRLAASAVAVGDEILLIGGYTVAADGGEVSTPEVYRINPKTGAASRAAEMPVPVDDAVAFTFQNRWVYLVSGWHDLANVNLVQVYDHQADAWVQATAFPGDPVFGHAGGMIDGVMVICDGVRIALTGAGKRRFELTDACYSGRIDEADHRRIHWSELPPHPGKARYRMAATGTRQGGARVLFAGGSDNPYNFNGIGYDGHPSAPGAGVFSWSLADGAWQEHGGLPQATMDHRGLPEVDGRFFIIGGMLDSQQVSDQVISFRLVKPQ